MTEHVYTVTITHLTLEAKEADAMMTTAIEALGGMLYEYSGGLAAYEVTGFRHGDGEVIGYVHDPDELEDEEGT
jgi:hypothetical protein